VSLHQIPQTPPSRISECQQTPRCLKTQTPDRLPACPPDRSSASDQGSVVTLTFQRPVGNSFTRLQTGEHVAHRVNNSRERANRALSPLVAKVVTRVTRVHCSATERGRRRLARGLWCQARILPPGGVLGLPAPGIQPLRCVAGSQGR